jgi:hypothetical protein
MLPLGKFWEYGYSHITAISPNSSLRIQMVAIPTSPNKTIGQDALDLHSTCPHPWWKSTGFPEKHDQQHLWLVVDLPL